MRMLVRVPMMWVKSSPDSPILWFPLPGVTDGSMQGYRWDRVHLPAQARSAGQNQLPPHSFQWLLFTHCSILLMGAGSALEVLAAQVEGGHPGARLFPDLCRYHSAGGFLFLSLILHQFSSSLWAQLYIDAESQKFQLFPESEWDHLYHLVSPDEQQWSASGELLHYSLTPAVSFPGAPQVLSGLLAGPGPLVILTKPSRPQACPWEVQPWGNSWASALGWQR